MIYVVVSALAVIVAAPIGTALARLVNRLTTPRRLRPTAPMGHPLAKLVDADCDPDCFDRITCPDAGKLGHSDCGLSLCGCPKHHVCEHRLPPPRRETPRQYGVPNANNLYDLARRAKRKNARGVA